MKIEGKEHKLSIKKIIKQKVKDNEKKKIRHKTKQEEKQIKVIKLSIITWNANGLNTPIKRVANLIKKQDPSICYLLETYFSELKTHRDWE